MEQIVQLGLSLLAILALGWLAYWLRLGGDRRIADKAEAHELAEAIIDGFDPVDIAIDRSGRAALLRDADDRIVVLRRHGARFAGRLLTDRAKTRQDDDLLIIDAGDRPFGSITLDLGIQAEKWAAWLLRIRADDIGADDIDANDIDTGNAEEPIHV